MIKEGTCLNPFKCITMKVTFINISLKPYSMVPAKSLPS